ncbi:chaplin [Streptomyces anandii]|uniref:chaplin n=1 Tax=Streptomyces anandii TaxID=285454 RepID=UPI0036FC0A59
MAVASGAMAVGGTAYADSAADGAASGSPGVVSGNSVQVPVDVPVNLCGNTVDLVGLLNPAMGNSCANHGAASAGDKDSSRSGQHGPSASGRHGSPVSGRHGSPVSRNTGSTTSGGATAAGVTQDSPGVLSGNGLQLPVHLPVNVSGNSVNAVGVGNPVFGNESVNGPHVSPTSEPRVHHQPATQVHRSTVVRQRPAPTLAHTGAEMPWAPAAASLISLTAGAVLYRRFRPRASHYGA